MSFPSDTSGSENWVDYSRILTQNRPNSPEIGESLVDLYAPEDELTAPTQEPAPTLARAIIGPEHALRPAPTQERDTPKNQGKYWCFTHFKIEDKPEVMFRPFTYLVYQLEKCPYTGKFHYQGYICFPSNQRLAGLKQFNKQTHWETRYKKHSEAKLYCMKDETRMAGPWEFGDDSDIPEGKGSRTDLIYVKKMLDEGKNMLEIADEHFPQFARYHKSFQLYKDLKDEKKEKEDIAIEFSAMKLRLWQQGAFMKLQNQTDRQVDWYWSQKGKFGKTHMAKWLEAIHGAFLITSGKHSDIYYAYEKQKIVVLDLARTHSLDKSLYEIIEGMKNGRIFSSKYMSKPKRFPSAKVIVFANFPPDEEMLSDDRLRIVELK